MEEHRSLIPVSPSEVEVIDDSRIEVIRPYNQAMRYAGYLAHQEETLNAFDQHRNTLRTSTQERHQDDLQNFFLYLQEATNGLIDRTAEDFYHDPAAWHDMTADTLKGYISWAERKGFATGTIRVRVDTIRLYCRLAGPKRAGVIDRDTLDDILEVKSYSDNEADNVDQNRKKKGLPTRVGRKKAKSTDIQTYQALDLKKATKTREQPSRRIHDQLLATRDALMMGLFLEHALRCSEVVNLNLENFDVVKGKVTFDRQKTHLKDQTHSLYKHTKIAAQRYLSLVKQLEQREAGPLFLGYQGKRISRQALNARVGEIGRSLGIEHLSPHDGRHYWTYDVLNNKVPINKIMEAGGWTTTEMVMRYAKRYGIANEDVKITEE